MTLISRDFQGQPQNADIETFVRDSIVDAAALWADRGGEEKFLHLGRVRIRLRMIGAGLPAVILPALQHAASVNDAADADATIYAVDSEETGFPAPPAFWPFHTATREAEMRTHWNGGAGPVLSSDESRGIWHLYDMESRAGLYWLRSCKGLPSWEAGSPLRHHIHWVSHAAGQGMLHAAVLSNGEGGVMLTGPGGSGKSTMTAAALRHGWQVTGEDFVLVAMNPVPTSYRLFDLIKLTGMAENLFADHGTHAINPNRGPDDKLMTRISSVYGENAFARQLPVNAVMSLKLTGEETSRIVPAARLDLLRAIVPSTSLILRTGMQETFAFASTLVRDLSCYTFLVGRDPLEGLQVLDRFMKDMAR